METKNPATPSQEATPGNAAQNSNQPNPVATPAPSTGDQGNNQEGKVTISIDEFKQLNRDAARGRSAQRRASLGNRSRSNLSGNEGNQALPDDVQAIVSDAESRAKAAEIKAAQSELRSKIRDILDKEEFKNIPRHTRELILKNPSALSDAEDPEEALLDVEDYLRDEVLPDISIPVAGMTNNTNAGNQPTPQPQAGDGRDTPPVVNSGAPAPSQGPDMEDPSKLHGPARSRAMIRNSLRGARKSN